MTENELLAELAAELYLAPLQPHEVTVNMLAEAAGITVQAAFDRLETGVRRGDLEWRWVRVANKRCKAYSKAGQPS